MNEQQAWVYLTQYIADSGLPYTTTLTKQHDSDEYQVEIKATFDASEGFDEIDTEWGWGTTVLEALLHLIENTQEPDTKKYLAECQERYKVTATRS